MNYKPIVKVVCLTIIGAPPLIASTQGIEAPPIVVLLLGLAAMAAGLVMAELEPGWRGGPDPEEIGAADDALARRVADEIEFRINAAERNDKLITQEPRWLPRDKG